MQIKTLATLAIVAASLTVSASGCATSLSLDTALNCAALIPPSLRNPVEDVSPPEDNTVGGWVAVADARSGKLDEANRNTAYVIEGADACQAESIRLQRKPWWAILRPG